MLPDPNLFSLLLETDPKFLLGNHLLPIRGRSIKSNGQPILSLDTGIGSGMDTGPIRVNAGIWAEVTRKRCFLSTGLEPGDVSLELGLRGPSVEGRLTPEWNRTERGRPERCREAGSCRRDLSPGLCLSRFKAHSLVWALATGRVLLLHLRMEDRKGTGRWAFILDTLNVGPSGTSR